MRVEPGKVKNMTPNPTQNLTYAVNTLDKVDAPTRASVMSLQTFTGNAYASEVKSEINRRTMNELEEDFKKWLMGKLDGVNNNKEGGKYSSECDVMNIKNPQEFVALYGENGEPVLDSEGNMAKRTTFMNPYTPVKRVHTNWGNHSLMHLDGVSDYLRSKEQQDIDARLQDAMLLEVSSGKLKDLPSAWEYFIYEICGSEAAFDGL